MMMISPKGAPSWNTQSRPQQVLPLQLANVNSLKALANGVGYRPISKSFGKTNAAPTPHVVVEMIGHGE
jgi:hypothetical protein